MTESPWRVASGSGGTGLQAEPDYSQPHRGQGIVFDAVVRSRRDRIAVESRFTAVGQRITAVVGTVIETVKRVAELAQAPKAKGKQLSA